LSVPALTEKSDEPSGLKTKGELTPLAAELRVPKLIVNNSRPVETSHNLIEPAIKSIEASNRPSGLKATLKAGRETPVCNTNSGSAPRGPDGSAVFAFGVSSTRIRCCGADGRCRG
jgi:hypothetical protein